MASATYLAQGTYAEASAPQQADNRGKPIFVVHDDIEGGGRIEAEHMFKALGTAVPFKDIAGIQKIGKLWRLYIENQSNRIKLINDGIKIRNSVVKVYDRNPFLPYASHRVCCLQSQQINVMTSGVCLLNIANNST